MTVLRSVLRTGARTSRRASTGPAHVDGSEGSDNYINLPSFRSELRQPPTSRERKEGTHTMKKPKCLICGKPAHPTLDRTTDGQHAHYDCLRNTQAQLTGKGAA